MNRTDRPAISPVLRVRAVSDLSAIAAQASELDELAEQASAPSSAYWAAQSAWFQARPYVQPLAIAVFDRTQLVGSAVLARQKVRGLWRVSGAGAPGEPFAFPIASPEIAPRLAGGIRDELAGEPGRWKLGLTDLPIGDPVVEALAAQLPESVREQIVDEPRLDFDTRSPLNHYLSRNVRSAVAKARNRVAADGHAFDLHWLRSPERIAHRLEDIVELRARRNEQLHRGTRDGAELATFTGTIVNQTEAGRTRLLEVRIDDQLAAYALCFLSAGTLWVYSNTVSPDFTRYSAGTIANAEVVRFAHDEPGVRCLSWGRGIQRYKMSGPVSVGASQTLTAWSSPSTRRLLQVGRSFRRLKLLV